MQFQQLQYFVAVAETRHFTRAADLVHVAQPSLSQQIKALERELGADLFLRARGNITLTDAGESLLPLARRILADADTARYEVQELAQLRRGRVRLGATPSVCSNRKSGAGRRCVRGRAPAAPRSYGRSRRPGR
ncbi:LysR family transcriptional regulator, partial [Streptomyces sp. NPDC001226]